MKKVAKVVITLAKSEDFEQLYSEFEKNKPEMERREPRRTGHYAARRTTEKKATTTTDDEKPNTEINEQIEGEDVTEKKAATTEEVHSSPSKEKIELQAELKDDCDNH